MESELVIETLGVQWSPLESELVTETLRVQWSSLESGVEEEIFINLTANKFSLEEK